MLNAVYLHEDFAQMPLPLRHLAHIVRSLFTDLTSEVSAEATHPKADAFWRCFEIAEWIFAHEMRLEQGIVCLKCRFR